MSERRIDVEPGDCDANVGVTGVIPAGEVVIVYADDLTVVVMADVSEVAASADNTVITVQ